MPDTEMAEVDQSAVDNAIVEILQAHADHHLAYAYKVGEAIYTHIFGSDLEELKAKSTKQASFRALVEDDRLVRLNLSKSTLHNYVSVHLQVVNSQPELAEALKALSLSHQVRLLRVKDEAKKLELADNARSEKWSLRTLTDHIAELPKQSTAGRREDHPDWKRVKILAKTAASVSRGFATESDFAEYAAIKTAEFGRVREDLRKLRELLAAAEAELARFDPSANGPTDGDAN